MSFEQLVDDAYHSRAAVERRPHAQDPHDKHTLIGRPFCRSPMAPPVARWPSTLTGESRVLKVDILRRRSLHQSGDRHRPDRGRFIRAWAGSPPSSRPKRPGHLSTHAPSTYKISANGGAGALHRGTVARPPQGNRAAAGLGGRPSCWRSASGKHCAMRPPTHGPGGKNVKDAPATAENMLKGDQRAEGARAPPPGRRPATSKGRSPLSCPAKQ
jgi:hypothetical protein